MKSDINHIPDYLAMFLLTTIVLLVLFVCVTYARAAVPEDQAVRAIIGEASNQGYEGMLAVACGIRNRGTLKGVYGVKAAHVDREPPYVWERARRAWQASLAHDITGGATHWENVKAFGVPYWVPSMDKTVKICDHQFYKPKG